MEDKYSKEIKEGNYIFIDKKRKPNVGYVIKEDGKLKCVGIYESNGNAITGGII